jgi:hypothetical protein
MKMNFCTLFNSAYLSRGLALYDSLIKCCPDFHLYVFAFDDICYQYFLKKKLAHLTVISLSEFEDPELLRIKPTRSAGEYCWTCTASTIRYTIKTYNLNQCTYLDADMYFYSNPEVLLNELNQDSVIITEHRYTKAYDQSEISGKYCVQFMTFNNDKEGMEVLEWWRNACIEWCYARVEDGKFGDQKYLDDWTIRFKKVHVLKHLGGGLAPWNMQQFAFSREGYKLLAKEKTTQKICEVVFFHFHGLKFYDGNIVSYTGEGYEMDEDAKKILFEPYTKELLKIGEKLKKDLPEVNYHAVSGEAPQKPMKMLSLLRWYLYDVKTSFRNINGRKTLNRIKHNHYYYTG